MLATICSNGHGRVLFKAVECPACSLVEQLKEKQSIIDGLEIEIYEMEKKVNERDHN